MRLVRTEYWNPSTGTVRTGSTGHGESLADMETYLLPLTAALLGGAFGSGVAQGLQVTATVGQQALTVGTGLALDGIGRPIVLSDGGAVVVDPNAPPLGQVQNVPLVLVGSGGVELPTTGLSGGQVLTLTAREALDASAGAASWSLVHAPWLRLVAQATFTDDGSSVPLALVTLDAAGAVTALDAGPRRQVSPAVGALTLRRSAVTGGQTPSVRADAGPSLHSRQDGGLDVVLPGPQAETALSVEGTTGNLLARGKVGFGAAPGVALVGMPDGTHVGLWGRGVAWGLTMDVDSGALATHSGLAVGADSPADLTVSGGVTVGAGANGVLSTRHVDGKMAGSDGPDDLHLNWGTGKTVHVGGDAAAALAVHGPAVVDANLTAGGIVNSFQYTTNGQSWLRGQVYTGQLFGHWDGNATMRLFGSSLYDLGDNWLQIQSGGGRTFMRGDVTVEGSSWLKGQVYTGELFGHWDGKATMRLFGSSLYDLGDGWLQIQSGGGKTYMRGEVTVQGALHKAGGGFRIDHPLAPDEKYLSHSFVESPEMVNLYNGIAVTDENGQAQVSLPDYFEVLNRDHRFQLTTIGQLAMATVEGEVRDNAFTIRTDKPGVTVSWQVTGVRQDSWAEAHRITVEEDKPSQENGSFLHPELFGQQADRAFLAAAPSESGDHAVAPALQSPPAPPLSKPPEPEGPSG
jgi:hypothetical protein